MKRSCFLFSTLIVVSSLATLSVLAVGDDAKPFSNSAYPLPAGWTGPTYSLHYPTSGTAVPDPPMPWRAATKKTGGKITADNALQYVSLVKDYIAPRMKVLVEDYANWSPKSDQARDNWYTMPWIADPVSRWNGREPIQGMYAGPGFGPGTYGGFGLKQFMQDYVAVYYDYVAAPTLNRTWGKDGYPALSSFSTKDFQFDDGSIIIKLAVTTASGNSDDANFFPPLDGSTPSLIYAPTATSTNSYPPCAPPALQTVYVMQFDLIVKDYRATISKECPGTGWVFATLVYDKRIKSNSTWDKLMPLGVMWGNKSADETWLNPVAPVYSTYTLGHENRLSGPNDAAVQLSAPVDGMTSPVPFFRMSSCLSCHGTAEFPKNGHSARGVPPILVPIEPTTGNFYNPDSERWSHYYQNRPGDKAQTGSNAFALDYGMVMRQALLNWAAATNAGLKFKHQPVSRIRP